MPGIQNYQKVLKGKCIYSAMKLQKHRGYGVDVRDREKRGVY
jgi:hypothetical protein